MFSLLKRLHFLGSTADHMTTKGLQLAQVEPDGSLLTVDYLIIPGFCSRNVFFVVFFFEKLTCRKKLTCRIVIMPHHRWLFIIFYCLFIILICHIFLWWHIMVCVCGCVFLFLLNLTWTVCNSGKRTLISCSLLFCLQHHTDEMCILFTSQANKELIALFLMLSFFTANGFWTERLLPLAAPKWKSITNWLSRVRNNTHEESLSVFWQPGKPSEAFRQLV